MLTNKALHLRGFHAGLVPEAERSVASDIEDQGARDDQVHRHRHLGVRDR